MNVVLTTLLQRWNHNIKLTTCSQRRYYDVKSQRCINFAPTLNKKFNSHYYHGCCNGNVDTTLKPYCKIHNVFSTSVLGRYKERKMWTTHGHVVTFSQPCHKVVKSLLTIWYFSDMQGQYFGIKFSPLFPPDAAKVPKSCFRKV